jgi:PAS domain-containing protein
MQRFNWDIDLSTQNLQEFCAVLNGFALPRAIVDFERHSFVAWNPRFLEQTGYSEDEIKSAKPEELLTFGESWFPLSDQKEGQTVEFISCAAKRPFGADPAPGYVIRSQSKIGYVMLDVSDSPSVQFEQGRTTGREEERNRIIKAYHEEVSSSMIAALFLIETAKNELEEAGLPQAEAVSKASDILTETTEKIADVLSNTDGNSQ